MPFPNIKPEPNFERLLTVLRRGIPDRVPSIEFWMSWAPIGEAPISDDPAKRWREVADIWLRLGYDAMPVSAEYPLDMPWVQAANTAPAGEATRGWRDFGHNAIVSWEDFEKYTWPRPEQVDYSDLEYAAKALPDGMKLLGTDPWGLFEIVQALFGMEQLAYALVDQPDLVQAVFDKAGEMLLAVCRGNASHEAVCAVLIGDDIGFKTQPTLSPAALRRYLFPWYKRVVEAVHSYGKPVMLHSCGQLESVMDDLIDDVGIDGKHSFEDAIMPVEEADRRWGDRIAILGGVDIDLLARGTPEQVRRRTRQILEACMPGGGYALSSGNSIPDYVLMENYFAMIEEGLSVGVYR
jgi:uroporphyrinogen decarboxylase